MIHILRLDRTTELIKQTMNQVIKEIKIEQDEMIRSLKKNPILATADWIFVEKCIHIQSPFQENLSARHHHDRIQCEHCRTYVTIPISKYEFEQTFDDCRIRILRLQKTHFWSDYYDKQLSSYGLHTLNTLCDQAIDTSEKLIDIKHLFGKNRLQTLANFIRIYTRKCQEYLPWYSNKLHYLPISFVIIFIECLIIIIQLHQNLCNNMKILYFLLEILSSILFIFDCIQIIYWFYHNRQRKYRFINFFWISLYSFAVICRFFSCIIYFILFSTQTNSRNICIGLYIFKSLSSIELIILILFFIEPIRLFADYLLHRYVNLSYDIGLTYISSEEQVLRIINRLTENKNIRIRIREHSLQQISTILKYVHQIQDDHPGTIISIKTDHTLNLLYHTAQHGIDQIRSRGIFDIDDCKLLEQSLKTMYNRIHMPRTMPPVSPLMFIRHLLWIFSNEQLTNEQKNSIEKKLTHEKQQSLQNFTWQEYLWKKSDSIQGVYILVNGFVDEWKIDSYDIDADQSELRWQENNRTRRATITTQQLLSSTSNQRNSHHIDDESIVSSVMISNRSVPIVFEDGFYVRWHRFVDDNQDTHIETEENFDRFFNEIFDQYRRLHPATNEQAYRCYSYSSRDCIGLYDINENEHQSTAKCLTNVTAFFISKEKLLDIINTYSLWNHVWLEIGK